MTIPAGVVRSRARLTPGQELAEIEQWLAAWIERTQNGGIGQLGLRLVVRDAVPSGAPQANQPTVVLVDEGSGPLLYLWNGTDWGIIESAPGGSPPGGGSWLYDANGFFYVGS